MCNTAVGHAMNDIGADHDATVMAANVFAHGHFAGAWVNADQHHMRFKGVAWVHLNSAIFSGQHAACWNFPDKLLLKSRLHALWQFVKFAVCNFNQSIPR